MANAAKTDIKYKLLLVKKRRKGNENKEVERSKGERREGNRKGATQSLLSETETHLKIARNGKEMRSYK